MINNTPKPTGSVNNVSKVKDFETWATILTTWGTETRTWLETGSLLQNTSKPTGSINNTAKPV